MFLNFISRTHSISLIVRSVAFALLVQSFISMPLWIGNEGLFPMISVFEDLTLELPTVIQTLLGYVYFIVLLLLLFSPTKYFNYLIPLFLSIVIFLILQDVTRLQVWMYLYFIILSVVYFCIKTKDQNILLYLRFILGGVYFWSGFHKFNIHYAETFAWMNSEIPLLKTLGTSLFAAKLSAFLELLLGILLIIQKQKHLTFTGLLIMHGFILISLISLDWNSIVYMWNIEMLFLVFLVLFKSEDKKIFVLSKVYYAIVFIIWVIPSLYIFDKIPACFSFNMYSGRDMTGTVVFHSKDVSIFPKILGIPIEKFKGIEPIGVDIDYWCIKINGVPSFADEMFYKRLNKKMYNLYSMKNYGGIRFKKYPRNLPVVEESYSCD